MYPHPVGILLPKAKLPGKLSIGDLVPFTFCPLVQNPCVTMFLKEASCIELCNYLIALVLLEAHDVLDVVGFTGCYDLIEDWNVFGS